MERPEILSLAKHRAEIIITEEGDLAKAIAEFVAQCKVGALDPPLHHASITHAILMAERGDEFGVRGWLERQV